MKKDNKVSDSPDLIEFGKKVQDYREKAELSQGELAEKMDVTSNTIYRMEGAIAVPGIDKLFLLADTFRVTPDTFMPERFYTENNDDMLKSISFMWNQLNDGTKKVAFNMIMESLKGLKELQCS